jgi:hypothetical protein
LLSHEARKEHKDKAVAKIKRVQMVFNSFRFILFYTSLILLTFIVNDDRIGYMTMQSLYHMRKNMSIVEEKMR